MDTAAASERGWGMDPVTAARAPPAGRPERRSDWTVATLADDPPPNTRACRPDTPAAASCSGAVRVPTWRTAPGTGLWVIRVPVPVPVPVPAADAVPVPDAVPVRNAY